MIDKTKLFTSNSFLLLVKVFAFLILIFFLFVANFHPFQSKKDSQSFLTNFPICSIKPLNSPSSTPRDVILAASFTRFKRIEYFIRTLRSTGTKARIILFIDKNKIRQAWQYLFSVCNLELVLINASNEIVKFVPKVSRYYFYYQRLKQNINQFDRVLHSDTFDVKF
jgi:hypothetical protein